MCGPICESLIIAVLKADAGKINVYYKIVIENQI